MSARVVSNTSPLLHQLGGLDWLRILYGQVIVPRAVVDELEVGALEGYDVPRCNHHPWMIIETGPVPAILSLVTALGAGEAEALALALAVPTELVLLDDRLARQVAGNLGLRLSGTLGVLLEAKRTGLVSEVNPLLVRLQELGFRVAPGLVARIARLAGEPS
jgi:hypothetical protein